MLLGEQSHTCVNNLSRVFREVLHPVLEPATYDVLVTSPNAPTITLHATPASLA